MKPVYLATGRAFDDEMVSRIESHRERRGDSWKTIEEPLALVDALQQTSFDGRMVLVSTGESVIYLCDIVEARIGG